MSGGGRGKTGPACRPSTGLDRAVRRAGHHKRGAVVMPLRPCLGLPGQPCGRLTARPDSRCPTCAGARERGRGNRHQRGYDADHVATRERLLPHAIGKPCPRCGELMLHGQALDLGHPPDAPLRLDRTSRGDRIEHATCNRGARD